MRYGPRERRRGRTPRRHLVTNRARSSCSLGLNCRSWE
jgi:hypothetical protein